MERNYRKTKTNKIARDSREYDFIVYRTPEEDKKLVDMYKRSKKPNIIISNKITQLFVKNTFHVQLKKVFEHIEPDFNSGWIRFQTGIGHSCIIRTLNGTIVPTAQNLFKFLYLIYNYLPKFNIWFLVDKSAPMLIDDNYTPFYH